MRIECPECGARYTFDKPIPLDKKYRCKKCEAVVTFTEVADIEETSAQIPEAPTQPQKQEIAREEQVSKAAIQQPSVQIPRDKPRPVKQEAAKKQFLQTGKKFSIRYLVIVGILVIVVIVVAFFMYC